MSFTQDGRAVAGNLAVENVVKASRVALAPRTLRSYSMSVTSGTMAAALGAGAAFFVMRLDPSSPVLAFIKRVRVQFTTIVAFTVPVTAGRRIGVYRGSGAAASGATAVLDFLQTDSTRAPSQFATAEGGSVQVATTAALTVTSIVYEAVALRERSLVHVGAAGAHDDFAIDGLGDGAPLMVLQPGQLLAIRTVPAMDAAGTWAATISIDWDEALAFDSSVADS